MLHLGGGSAVETSCRSEETHRSAITFEWGEHDGYRGGWHAGAKEAARSMKRRMVAIESRDAGQRRRLGSVNKRLLEVRRG